MVAENDHGAQPLIQLDVAKLQQPEFYVEPIITEISAVVKYNKKAR